MNDRRAPQGITDPAELESLDESQLVAGYRAGLENAPDWSARDPGYWHGYLNGLVDGGHVTTPSEVQRELARRYVEQARAR
jgi:hypothetical protein